MLPHTIDIKLAHELQPQTSEMAKELETIEQMMTLPFPELKRTIQRQRDACEAFNPEYVMTDDDGKVSVVEQRVKCSRKYPSTFSCKTTGPPRF